jgi:hypothetical protein
MSTIAPPRSNAGLQRWAALGGAAYVVLFVVGVVLTYSGAVDSSAPPAKVIAYYSDSGHRDRINFGWLIAGLGVFFFLWFLSALRQGVRRLEVDDGFLTGLTTIGGVVYASLTLAALAVETGIRTMSDDTYHHTVRRRRGGSDGDRGFARGDAGGGRAHLVRVARHRRRHPRARADRVLPVVPVRDLDPGREHRDVRPCGPRAGGKRLGMRRPGPFSRARAAFALRCELHRASTWSADASHLPFVNR